MQLQTSRFGEIAIDADAVITLTQPIIGFQERRRFVMLAGPEGSGVCWLQSVDSGDLAFLLMNPKDAVPDYKVSIGAHELSELAATDASDVDVYTLLVIPEDRRKIRTNLKAPILINSKQRLGKQTVLDRGDYAIQHYLRLEQAATPQKEEVGNARTDA